MKYVFQILFCAGISLVLWSCKDEDRIHIPEHLTGVNMRIIVDPDHRQINYQTVTTDKFAFDAYSENDDLQEVAFTATYRDQTVVVATFGQSDFADGSVRVELTANDFATTFGVPGFADGTNGGNFVIRPRVTLNDGRVYPDYVHLSETDSILNVATSIIGSSAANGAFTLQVLTSITCTPVDISGDYLVTSAVGTSTDGCCPGEVTVSGNIVKVTAVNETTFALSDFSGGLYFEWYDVYGISGPDDSPGQLVYNCSEVNFSGTTEPFGTGVSGGGPYDAATGTITYSWINGYGDQGTITLVRQ
jgi:hypothetical protein